MCAVMCAMTVPWLLAAMLVERCLDSPLCNPVGLARPGDFHDEAVDPFASFFCGEVVTVITGCN